MKKLLSLLLILTLCLSLLPGCGKKEAAPVSISSDDTQITVTLPAFLFDSKAFDPEDYSTENGILSATQNEDGSVTVTMTKTKHQEVMESVAETVGESFRELIGAEGREYITDITYTEHFETVTVTVVREEFEKSLNFVDFIISMNVMLYQSLLQEDFHTTLIIVDDATGDIISTTNYPEALESE